MTVNVFHFNKKIKKHEKMQSIFCVPETYGFCDFLAKQ